MLMGFAGPPLGPFQALLQTRAVEVDLGQACGGDPWNGRHPRSCWRRRRSNSIAGYPFGWLARRCPQALGRSAVETRPGGRAGGKPGGSQEEGTAAASKANRVCPSLDDVVQPVLSNGAKSAPKEPCQVLTFAKCTRSGTRRAVCEAAALLLVPFLRITAIPKYPSTDWGIVRL